MPVKTAEVAVDLWTAAAKGVESVDVRARRPPHRVHRAGPREDAARSESSSREDHLCRVARVGLWTASPSIRARECRRVPAREGRYTQELRERHEDFLRRCVELEARIERAINDAPADQLSRIGTMLAGRSTEGASSRSPWSAGRLSEQRFAGVADGRARR